MGQDMAATYSEDKNENENALAIRSARPADCELILAMIRELADYERLAQEVVARAEDLHTHLFGPDARASVLLAFRKGEPAGFALWFFNFSTFLGRPGLYLEDLFVRPPYRSQGIGKALLSELSRVAVDNGCGRMEWSVLDWNESALRFYRSLGAIVMEDWRTCRLTEKALRELAGESAS